jgi:phenylacetate-CoA ligase
MKLSDPLLEIYQKLFTEYSGQILTKNIIAKTFPVDWMTTDFKFALENDGTESTFTSGTTSDKMLIIREKNWWKQEYQRTYQNHPLLKEYLDTNRNKVIFTTAVCSNTVCHFDKPDKAARTNGTTLYLNTCMDPNNWSEADIRTMAQEWNDHQPFYVDADPHYLSHFLARIQKDFPKIQLIKPEIMTLSYEFVTRATKKHIENFFKLKTVNLYGSTELGYIFIEDDEGNMKVCPDLIECEYVSCENQPDYYRLIVTSMKNKFMPLVKYDTGDIVYRPSGTKEGTVKSIAGRTKDAIPTETHFVFQDRLDHYVFAVSEEIIKYAVKKSKSGLQFTYVTLKGNQLPENDVQRLQETLEKLFQTPITLLLTASLSPVESGKFQLFKDQIKV